MKEMPAGTTWVEGRVTFIVAKCPIEGCDRPVDKDRLCKVHDHYFKVVLADPKYRTEPSPVVTESGIQAVMPWK